MAISYKIIKFGTDTSSVWLMGSNNIAGGGSVWGPYFGNYDVDIGGTVDFGNGYQVIISPVDTSSGSSLTSFTCNDSGSSTPIMVVDIGDGYLWHAGYGEVHNDYQPYFDDNVVIYFFWAPDIYDTFSNDEYYWDNIYANPEREGQYLWESNDYPLIGKIVYDSSSDMWHAAKYYG